MNQPIKTIHIDLDLLEAHVDEMGFNGKLARALLDDKSIEIKDRLEAGQIICETAGRGIMSSVLSPPQALAYFECGLEVLTNTSIPEWKESVLEADGLTIANGYKNGALELIIGANRFGGMAHLTKSISYAALTTDRLSQLSISID